MEKLVEESKEFRVDQKSEHEGGRPVRVLGPEDELPAAGGAEHPEGNSDSSADHRQSWILHAPGSQGIPGTTIKQKSS
jgi:hypothetical protein